VRKRTVPGRGRDTWEIVWVGGKEREGCSPLRNRTEVPKKPYMTGIHYYSKCDK